MLVRDIMRRDFYAFRSNDSLEKVSKMMVSHRLYGGPVVDNSMVLEGIFTRPHLIRAFLNGYDPNAPVNKLMQKSVITLNPDCDFSEAMKVFVDTDYHNLPVVDKNGILVGLMLSSDMLQIGAQQFYKLFGSHNVEHFGNALIGIDAKGYIRSVSKTAHEVFGRDLRHLTNKHVIETIPLMESLSKAILMDAKKARELSRQLSIAQRRIEYYRSQLETMRESKYTFSEIIGMSPAMRKLRSLASQAAKTSSTILIRGESGTGKELLAHAIHNASPRCREPFVKVNCAAIPEHLMESELFGYCEGAFTGAVKGGKPGKFELADRGTIFLDEVGDLHPIIQAKLLRVLQEFEFERLGGTKTVHVDVRIIAATNRNLEELISRRLFRRDLFYRLNVVAIETPPLRNRKEDIDYLTDYLIEKICERLDVDIVSISESARKTIKNYNFPGNVRELENILERGINFVGDMGIIESEDLPVLKAGIEDVNGQEQDEMSPGGLSLAEIVGAAEKKAIVAALDKTGGSKKEAARLLNIHRSLLYKKINKHNIS